MRIRMKMRQYFLINCKVSMYHSWLSLGVKKKNLKTKKDAIVHKTKKPFSTLTIAIAVAHGYDTRNGVVGNSNKEAYSSPKYRMRLNVFNNIWTQWEKNSVPIQRKPFSSLQGRTSLRAMSTNQGVWRRAAERKRMAEILFTKKAISDCIS